MRHPETHGGPRLLIGHGLYRMACTQDMPERDQATSCSDVASLICLHPGLDGSAEHLLQC